MYIQENIKVVPMTCNSTCMVVDIGGGVYLATAWLHSETQADQFEAELSKYSDKELIVIGDFNHYWAMPTFNHNTFSTHNCGRNDIVKLSRRAPVKRVICTTQTDSDHAMVSVELWRTAPVPRPQTLF